MKLKTRIYFTGIITLLVWAHLAWDYFNGGVPTHYILHREDLPGFSNWWGAIVLPLLSWYLLFRIDRRIDRNENSGVPQDKNATLYRFMGALLYAILISLFFTIGSDFPAYMMMGLILLSFFVPLYRPEYLLGFVIGMAFTFGAILPTGIGILLMIIFAIAYKIVRTGVLYVASTLSRLT